MRIMFRKFRVNRRGGVLVEVAVVVFFLMFLLVGMASITIELSQIEKSGRSMKEVTEMATQMMLEEGSLTDPVLDRLSNLALARNGGDLDNFGFRFSRVYRDVATGDYILVQERTIGGIAFDPLPALVQVPSPNPGIHMLGEVIALDVGQEILIVHYQSLYQPFPVGVRAPKTYTQVAFSLMP